MLYSNGTVMLLCVNSVAANMLPRNGFISEIIYMYVRQWFFLPPCGQTIECSFNSDKFCIQIVGD